MANEFVDPTQVVQTALALVRDDLALAATVNRDYEADFGGGKGAVVNVRIPATLKARTRALGSSAAIVVDDVAEDTIAVSLSEMAYSAVKVTDQEMLLNLTDFGRQVLAPQTIALGEHVENLVVATMQQVAETALAYDQANPRGIFTKARKSLRDMGAPQTGLYAAVGTGVYADLLDAKQIADASQSGSTAALREGQVGRVNGFTTIEDNRLADDEVVFYHGDAFTLAIRAPRVPDSIKFGSTLAADGFAVRWIKDYDSSVLEERSILSTFLGCKAMPIRHLKADGSTEDVTPAIRVLTAS